MKTILEKIKSKANNESDKHLCTVYWCVLEDKNDRYFTLNKVRPLHTVITEKSANMSLEKWLKQTDDERWDKAFQTAFDDYWSRTGHRVNGFKVMEDELVVGWKILDPYNRPEHMLVLLEDDIEMTMDEFDVLEEDKQRTIIDKCIGKNLEEDCSFEIISLVHVPNVFED